MIMFSCENHLWSENQMFFLSYNELRTVKDDFHSSDNDHRPRKDLAKDAVNLVAGMKLSNYL